MIQTALSVALSVVICLSAWMTSSEASDAAPSGAKVLGFVVSSMVWPDVERRMRAKDEKSECPDGPVLSNRDNWQAQFPSEADRKRHLEKCWDIQNRGPNCENVWLNPALVKDPLPFRELKGRSAYGLNLDGTIDGRATDKTCAHEKFTSTDGTGGVDNQYYRFIGCHKSLLSLAEPPNNLVSMQKYALNRLVFEISGVDNEQNDDSVTVKIYRSNDPLIVDSERKALPWQTHHVTGAPLYELHGSIKDGTLQTEPADVLWAATFAQERLALIRGMTFQLKLSPDGMEGIRAGYIDLKQLWEIYSHMGVTTGQLFYASAPAAYEAMHRLADGYKDPKTSACTALSSAVKFSFVRAYVIHPQP
jgi:hypothetical protein